MKKYLIIALCTINAVNGMEHDRRGNIEPYEIAKKVERNPREWPAELYEAGNIQQTKAFLKFIEKNNFTIKGNTILSVGCGTGKIESILLEEKNAKSIHGIDASKNMINLAQNKYGNIKNLTFGRVCAEDFHPGFQKDSATSFSQKKYDSAYASFSMHWIEDKKSVLMNINQALKKDGEFLAAILTTSNPKPFNLAAAENMFPFLSWFDLSGLYLSSDEELKTMLHEAGFDILKFEEQSFQDKITEQELREGLWPIAASTPLMKIIPQCLEQWFFDKYVEECKSLLEKTNDNKISYKILITIIHARKKA